MTMEDFRRGERTADVIDYSTLEDVKNELLIQYPKFANHPEYHTELAKLTIRFNGKPRATDVLRLSQKYGINLLSSGGSGQSAEQKANTIRSFSAAIINASGKFGISLTPEEIAYIAKVAEDQNFSADQLNDVILDQANWSTVQPGELTANVDSIKAIASAYFVPVSENTLQDYSKRIASGESSFEAIKSLITQQAKAANPWLNSVIDSGATLADVFARSKDQIAQSLGIDASTVDFTQSRFMDMATTMDEKTGRRLATSSELTANIRQDAAWESTAEAKQIGAALGQNLARIFGRSAF